MTYALFNTIANAFGMIFGQSLLIPLFIIMIVVIGLLALRVSKAVILIILAPLTTTMVIYGGSKFLYLPADSGWIVFLTFAGLGLVMAGVFWAITRA